MAGLSTALALAEAEPTASIVAARGPVSRVRCQRPQCRPAVAVAGAALARQRRRQSRAPVGARPPQSPRPRDRAAGWRPRYPASGVEPRALRIEAQGHLTATGLPASPGCSARPASSIAPAAGPHGHLAIDLDTHTVDPYRTVRALGDDGAAARHRDPRGMQRSAASRRRPMPSEVSLADGRRLSARAPSSAPTPIAASLALPESRPKAKVVYNFMVATEPLETRRLGRAAARSDRFVVELNTSYVFYRIHQGRVGLRRDRAVQALRRR